MFSKNPLITIGIIFGKNDLKYLTYTLKSIFEQTYQNFEVIMHNNVLNEDYVEADDQVWQWIEENYPKVKLERSGNIGFGPAHNCMIRQMRGDYYLCYNPDIILEKDFLEQLVNFSNANQDEKVGVIGGRLMYWDFAKRDTESLGKTNQIDSLGLKIKKTHRVVDLGQGEQLIQNSKLKIKNDQKEIAQEGNEANLKIKVGDFKPAIEVADSGQARMTDVNEVFGLSGAMFLASREALDTIAYDIKSPLRGLGGVAKVENNQKDVAQESNKGNIKVQVGDVEPTFYKEFFDETIFLYKEDVDLAYRMRLARFKTFIVNNAVAYHDRSVEGNTGIIGSRKSKKRIAKGQTINTWSFYHHHIMLYKNWQSGFSVKVKLATFCYELCSNLFVLCFEFSTFKNGWKLFKQNFVEIKKRRNMTVKKISAQEIEKWMR